MTTILKYAAKVFFFVLAVMLIAWSASRGLDFIQSTLPVGQKANGYFGLAGTEIVCWFGCWSLCTQHVPLGNM